MTKTKNVKNILKFSISVLLLFFFVDDLNKIKIYSKSDNEWFIEFLILYLYFSSFILVIFVTAKTIFGEHIGNPSTVKQWVSDCCLTPIQQISSYIMASAAQISAAFISLHNYPNGCFFLSHYLPEVLHILALFLSTALTELSPYNLISLPLTWSRPTF